MEQLPPFLCKLHNYSGEILSARRQSAAYCIRCFVQIVGRNHIHRRTA